MDERTYVNQRLTDGWRHDGSIDDRRNGPEGYARGVLCRITRCPSGRPAEWRTVWVDETGAVDADTDRLGYVVTADGRKL